MFGFAPNSRAMPWNGRLVSRPLSPDLLSTGFRRCAAVGRARLEETLLPRPRRLRARDQMPSCHKTNLPIASTALGSWASFGFRHFVRRFPTGGPVLPMFRVPSRSNDPLEKDLRQATNMQGVKSSSTLRFFSRSVLPNHASDGKTINSMCWKHSTRIQNVLTPTLPERLLHW